MPIKIEHLSHVYQPGSPFQSDALQDIDFTIEDGELLALIGHTSERQLMDYQDVRYEDLRKITDAL